MEEFTGTHLRELIQIVDDLLGDTAYFAHVVIHDYNLDDGDIDWVLEIGIGQIRRDID